jgi:hypothetical protein
MLAFGPQNALEAESPRLQGFPKIRQHFLLQAIFKQVIPHSLGKVPVSLERSAHGGNCRSDEMQI